jgi:hypothetical protein
LKLSTIFFSFLPFSPAKIRNLVSSWGCISSSVSLLKIQGKTGLSAGLSGQEERTASGSVLFPATYPTPLGCTFLLSRCNPPPPPNKLERTYPPSFHPSDRV